MEVTPAPADPRLDARGRPRGDDRNDGVFGALLDTSQEGARTAKPTLSDKPKVEDQVSGMVGESIIPFGMTENAPGAAQIADRLLAALAGAGGTDAIEVGGREAASALGLPAGPPPQSAPAPGTQPSSAPSPQPAPTAPSIEPAAQAGQRLPDGDRTETSAPPPAAPKFGDRIELRNERMPEISRPSQDLVRAGPPTRPDLAAPSTTAAPSAAMPGAIAANPGAIAANPAAPAAEDDLPTDSARPADTLQAAMPGSGKAERAIAADTASVARPQPATATVRDQIVVQIVRAAGEGLDRIGVQLNPPALGRVDIRLDLGGDGRVVATVTADHQSTLDLMQRDARGLERALNDAGLKADPGGLSFNLRDGGGSDGRNGRGAGPTPAAEPDSTKDSAAQTQQPRQSRHDGALDMSV